MLLRRHTNPVKQNKFLIKSHEHGSKMFKIEDIKALKTVTVLRASSDILAQEAKLNGECWLHEFILFHVELDLFLAVASFIYCYYWYSLIFFNSIITIGAVPLVPRHQSHKKIGKLCSEVKANLHLLLFKIPRHEGLKENWVLIMHNALFLQNVNETFSTPIKFVWVLCLSSNFIIYASFLSFSF